MRQHLNASLSLDRREARQVVKQASKQAGRQAGEIEKRRGESDKWGKKGEKETCAKKRKQKKGSSPVPVPVPVVQCPYATVSVL